MMARTYLHLPILHLPILHLPIIGTANIGAANRNGIKWPHINVMKWTGYSDLSVSFDYTSLLNEGQYLARLLPH